MKKYYLKIIADNIYLQRGVDLPIAGFVAPRMIRAKNQDDAIALAKTKLLKEWKQTFNRDNKSGTPQLSIAQCQRIKNPLCCLQQSDEYIFYGSEDEKQAAIDNTGKAFARWFVIPSIGLVKQ